MSYPYSPESFRIDPNSNEPINLTMDWFANTSYYPPRAGVLTEPLVKFTTPGVSWTDSP